MKIILTSRVHENPVQGVAVTEATQILYWICVLAST